MNNYTIEKLYVYPVKGLKGIEVEEALFEKEGLQYDRRWMIVDVEDQKFISQRSHPQLALFKTKIENGKLYIHYGEDYVSFDVSLYNPDLRLDVTVWNDTVNCHEVDTSISYWLSNKLDWPCKLVSLTDRNARIKIYGKEKNSTTMSFADGYPALILGTASMDFLNEKSSTPIHYNRFRPNILVKTFIPHEEDTWSKCETSDVSMQLIKPCVRCQVINIDQDLAEKMLEPTKTLAVYRMSENGIIFGMNTVCLKEGVLRKGDILKIE